MRIKREKPAKLGIIGKIKIGEKNDKGYPVSLDYFVSKSKIKAFENMFNELYHKKETLPVCFSCNDRDFNTDHRHEIRTHQGKLYAYGDDNDFYISNDTGFKLYENTAILEKYESIENFKAKIEMHLSTQKYAATWKEVLTLKFIIPNIPVLGVWELRTMASKSSINQILGSYDIIEQINGGTVSRVPFLLSVHKVKSARALKGVRVYPVISLTPLLPEAAKEGLIDKSMIEAPETKMIEK